ncbi:MULTISPECIES: GPW/gp25 family protein [Aquimarina]|uniref:GPW/gp25 family protein n=1 Tax=Aquimarina algiphila TaxID=2047982 RepID=A0A554VPK4_9FLAO|nr:MULTISPECIES: GPW/gp25 family protein [Aquimarina]TSE10411.1 GPW/gp25 family protein [Aquimarina algiphila]
MDQNNEQSYLGKGWSFPPSFDQNKKEVDIVLGVKDIEQSLQILLSTRPGERLLRPSFGCNLDIMLFEPVTTTLITLVRDMVRKAILFYEARIDVNEIDINTENLNAGIILIDIDYTIRSTNSRFNFVYPFYLEEAIDISRI